MAHNFKANPELTNAQLETLRFTSPHKQIEDDFIATVVEVHDGDTIKLRTTFRDFDFPLRFAGIDAPEMNNGGEKARDWLRGQILGKSVEIKIDPNNRVGKFGRLIGSVIYQGLDMGQTELHLGLVFPFGKKLESSFMNMDKELSTRWLQI